MTVAAAVPLKRTTVHPGEQPVQVGLSIEGADDQIPAFLVLALFTVEDTLRAVVRRRGRLSTGAKNVPVLTNKPRVGLCGPARANHQQC